MHLVLSKNVDCETQTKCVTSFTKEQLFAKIKTKGKHTLSTNAHKRSAYSFGTYPLFRSHNLHTRCTSIGQSATSLQSKLIKIQKKKLPFIFVEKGIIPPDDGKNRLHFVSSVFGRRRFH